MLDLLKTCFPNLKPRDVYCQHCSEDLTLKGGDIATNNKIYCHEYKKGSSMKCFEKSKILNPDFRISPGIYLDPLEVQKAIRHNQLTEFGPLENKLYED